MDAAPELVNHVYIVNAHILEVAPRGRWGSAEEKYMALCLPGMLPGFYMGFNQFGFAFTVNAISTPTPKKLEGYTRKLLKKTLLPIFEKSFENNYTSIIVRHARSVSYEILDTMTILISKN